jgi:hypothetical protein
MRFRYLISGMVDTAHVEEDYPMVFKTINCFLDFYFTTSSVVLLLDSLKENLLKMTLDVIQYLLASATQGVQHPRAHEKTF